MKKVPVVILLAIIIFVGYLVINRDTRDGATFIESLRLVLDKNYETEALRKNRAAVKNTHTKNIRALWEKDYITLGNNFKNPYILLENNGSIDFVEAIRKEADSPILSKNVNELYDFNNIQAYNYHEMIEKGFMKTKEGSADVMKEGDFFAIIQPNKNSPDKNSIESMIVLYRKDENGKWIGIAGYR